MAAVAIWLATVGYAVIYQGIRTVQHVPQPFSQLFSLTPAATAAAATIAKTTPGNAPPPPSSGAARSVPAGPGRAPIVAGSG